MAGLLGLRLESKEAGLDPSLVLTSLVSPLPGSYVWSDGSPFDGFEFWAEGEPNSAEEKCVEMHESTGKWNDVACDSYSSRQYICQARRSEFFCVCVHVYYSLPIEYYMTLLRADCLTPIQ